MFNTNCSLIIPDLCLQQQLYGTQKMSFPITKVHKEWLNMYTCIGCFNTMTTQAIRLRYP